MHARGGRLMADASWVHLGRDYTYGLIVEGKIVGLAYWRDAELLDEDAQPEPAVNDPGWFWTATDSPRSSSLSALSRSWPGQSPGGGGADGYRHTHPPRTLLSLPGRRTL